MYPNELILVLNFAHLDKFFEVTMEFYTLEEVSKDLRITVNTARKRIRGNKGMPPAIKSGRSYLFPTVEFEIWVKDSLTIFDGKPKQSLMNDALSENILGSS